MSSLTPTLYLPIEEVNREFDSKLLIALELLGDGITVIIGRNPLLVANFAFMPPGAILFKGMNTVPALVMKSAVANGHVALTTDEEALGIAEIHEMVRNMDPSTASSCQIFFAQGRRHAEAMALRIPEATDRIQVVGNARLDLLREPFRSAYLEEAREHERIHGDYVMINTNFGAINSQWGDADAFKKVLERIGWLDSSKASDREYYECRLRTEKANITLIRGVLERLAARFPDTTFIIRPHPAERDVPWRQAYGDRANVHVTAEGNHISWLLGSKLLLHTGCTTGLEAEVLGVPCLTLLPPDHGSLSSADLLSNQANERAVGVDQAVAVSAHILNGRVVRDPTEREARLLALRDHLEALNGRFAYQRIANEIRTLLIPALENHPTFDWLPTDREAFVKTREHSERRLGKTSRSGYLWNKAEIDRTVLSRRIESLSQAIGSTLDPIVSEVADGVFRLEVPPG